MCIRDRRKLAAIAHESLGSADPTYTDQGEIIDHGRGSDSGMRTDPIEPDTHPQHSDDAKGPRHPPPPRPAPGDAARFSASGAADHMPAGPRGTAAQRQDSDGSYRPRAKRARSTDYAAWWRDDLED
eukprot:9501257-Pyramimonas_sp.AAC.1